MNWIGIPWEHRGNISTQGVYSLTLVADFLLLAADPSSSSSSSLDVASCLDRFRFVLGGMGGAADSPDDADDEAGAARRFRIGLGRLAPFLSSSSLLDARAWTKGREGVGGGVGN